MPKSKRGKTGILVYGMYIYYRGLLAMKGYLNKRNDFNVSFREYCNVLRLFNKKVKDAIIYDSWVFKLPYRLGYIYVKKIKMRFQLDKNGELYKHKLVPDWLRTKELWKKIYPGLTNEELKAIPHKKLIYITNEHTYGYKFIIFWKKRNCNIPGHGPYEFIFAKDNRRELAKLLKSNPNITYYE